jgi:hypothetical protein
VAFQSFAAVSLSSGPGIIPDIAVKHSRIIALLVRFYRHNIFFGLGAARPNDRSRW